MSRSKKFLRYKLFILNNNSPRWLVFFIDLTIITFSILIAYMLRFNFNIPTASYFRMSYVVPFVILVRAITFIIAKTYHGVIRYTSFKDISRIFLVISSGSLVLMIINFLDLQVKSIDVFIPTSILLLDFIVSVYLLSTARLFFKSLYNEIINKPSLRKNVLIYGSRELAVLSFRATIFDKDSNYKVVGFLDNNIEKIKKKIEGLPVYPVNHLEDLINKQTIDTIILANEHISSSQKEAITEICLEKNVKILTIPKLKSWDQRNLTVNKLKNIRIEDLLERKPINIAKKEISKEINNRVVLVTGAAGSIGSELVRQLTYYKPKQIVLVDQAETPLYDLELELSEKLEFPNFEIVIGDITNKQRLENIFKTYSPSIIYHAAAYKHVPMMENCPVEAAQNNIIGTKMLADLSIKFEVSKFIMVSTDKAVKPTNVMGASKRVAEMYIQSLNSRTNTRFITTRFGNVLGSNGSVIPRFKKQIEEGGPVTVTHPDIQRYFMTIPEACQLVLEASIMGNGGEIFIFDMGKSVKISDLAKKMIKLSGHIPDVDIKIQYTGLRPGEKLYEELLNEGENNLPTYHPKIKIAKIQPVDYSFVAMKILELFGPIRSEDNMDVVRIIKEIVPDFKSQNSVFQSLDSEFEFSEVPKS